MKIVLGVGNPGREYEGTRHNAGYRVLDRVSAALGTEIRRRKFRGLVGDGYAGHDSATSEKEHVILVKPQTYVNAAGECARLAVDFYGVPAKSFLAVLDDVDLPLGLVRIRRGGSSGGHNGMRSLIRHLGTEGFARLRVGVGRPDREADGQRQVGARPCPRRASARSEAAGGLVGHVLGAFSMEEVPIVEAAVDLAAEAVLDWALNGVEHCMNEFNRPAEERKEQS